LLEVVGIVPAQGWRGEAAGCPRRDAVPVWRVPRLFSAVL